MKTVKATTLAVITSALCLAGTSFTSSAMDEYVESALINVCKSAMSNSVIRYNKTIKGYRLKNKTVALKVMCNGDDIITFAEKHNADKTAARMSKALGQVQISDLALVQKQSVTF
ncbi:DUF3718 domain-containing protein [Thalassotalea sp. PLHSN55]|uniref:DUF3718 domain-containing protein n=1 Tax=Thalassotalea sp. PLHSN55 TaxID=3435888 RepID=UPI003F8692E6